MITFFPCFTFTSQSTASKQNFQSLHPLNKKNTAAQPLVSGGEKGDTHSTRHLPNKPTAPLSITMRFIRKRLCRRFITMMPLTVAFSHKMKKYIMKKKLFMLGGSHFCAPLPDISLCRSLPQGYSQVYLAASVIAITAL